MFVEVIVPVSIPNTFTYGVPVEMHDRIKIGQRVQVQFGKRKRYSAVVVKSLEKVQVDYEVKPIISILDEEPLITTTQIWFWKWMSNYYMANIGDVLSVALPSALKLSSESSVKLILEHEFDASELSDDEYLVFEALSTKNELKIQEIQLILGKKNVYPILTKLIQKRIVAMKETLKQRYKPKTETYVRLSDSFKDEQEKKAILDALDNAPKQLTIVLTYLSIHLNELTWIRKKDLLKKANVSSAVFKALCEKQIFIEKQQQIDRLQNDYFGDLKANLSNEQTTAFHNVKEGFKENKPVLLHGITGSGKTHIYIKLIEEQIQQEKQTLYLLPEIALTSQIIQRLRNHFGNDVGIYHSKFTDAERVEIWNKTRSKTYKVIVGARSALFLPFQDLGMVIIDEEHDTSYKQFDPSPRYHARDSALVLAHKWNANCLLGSATPSFESYFNAKQNKYKLVELNQRFGDIALPEIEVVNMLKQFIPGKTYQKFSKRLVDELRLVHQENKQSILFRNRRGYSSLVQCTACANTIKCENCDVSLTYHKFRDQLECHYCGFKQKVPYRCSACGHNELEQIGLGTERIQEEINVFIPSAKIGRMDLDTTRNKNGHEKIIQKFEQKEIDILVGTQMVTKGLHFKDVRLVGVLNTDGILKFPDFRVSERAFQLLEQVSGRAGRSGQQGKVIIQVRDDKDIVLSFLKKHDYIGFFEATIGERWKWKYPPYYRQIKLSLKHKDWKTNYQASIQLSNLLREKSNQMIKGPSEPSVAKVNNYFIQEILVTIEKNQQEIIKTKQLIQKAIDYIKQQKGNSQLRINVDVDPM